MTTTNNIWATLCNMKYKGYILGMLVTKYQKLDRRINIFLAITSSSSIAAWVVWKEYPLLWSGIIAASQVIMAIKPFFPYNKITKELNTRASKMELLNIEYERIWKQIQKNKLTDDQIEQHYFDYARTYAEVLNFPEDIVIETPKRIEDKGNIKMKNYLKTYYGIETND